MKPPMIPHQGRANTDTVNFRNVKESASVDIGAARALKGVPLDSGLRTPGGEAVETGDPFGGFESVTLWHEGRRVLEGRAWSRRDADADGKGRLAVIHVACAGRGKEKHLSMKEGYDKRRSEGTASMQRTARTSRPHSNRRSDCGDTRILGRLIRIDDDGG